MEAILLIYYFSAQNLFTLSLLLADGWMKILFRFKAETEVLYCRQQILNVLSKKSHENITLF